MPGQASPGVSARTRYATLMKASRVPASLAGQFALLSAFFAAALFLSSRGERALVVRPVGRDLPRFQSADEDWAERDGGEEAEEDSPVRDRTEKGVAQKISRANGRLEARYDFLNFNKDSLSVSFSMGEKDYGEYLAGYGYSDIKLAGLERWWNDARRKEWNKAVKKGGEAAGKEALKAVDWEYKVRLNEYFRSRGFALRPGNVIVCDVPGVVLRNVPLLKTLALSFQKISEDRGYGPEETVGAVLSMVQTAIRYKIPPMMDGALHTGGLWPPGRTLLGGWGDCDSKTALAASILGSWSGMRLVGIDVPGHYLMAIRRFPAKGDMFVTYEGLEYVLIEPAGPAWLEPGTVGKQTAGLLQGSEGYRIEPFFEPEKRGRS